MAPTEPAWLLHSVETIPTASTGKRRHKQMCSYSLIPANAYTNVRVCVRMVCNVASVSDQCLCLRGVCFSSGYSFHLSMNRHGLSPAALYKT